MFRPKEIWSPLQEQLKSRSLNVLTFMTFSFPLAGHKNKPKGNMQDYKSGIYWRVWDPLPTEEHLNKKKCSTSLSVPCPLSVELGVLSEVAFLHLPLPTLLESLEPPYQRGVCSKRMVNRLFVN